MTAAGENSIMIEDHFEQQAESLCDGLKTSTNNIIFINSHAIAKTAQEQIPCNSFVVVRHVNIWMELVMKEFCTKQVIL